MTVNQYNQGIGKNKLLSSNAGVGSIITTRMGYYILVSDINKWDFVYDANKIVNEIRNEEPDNFKRYEKSRLRIPNKGIGFVDDKRFVEFLKSEKDLPNLVCLVSIPSISLNEQFNSPNWRNHPINKLLEGRAKSEQFMVKGTHFPKWFKNETGALRTYADWKYRWNQNQFRSENFVPPRDAKDPIVNQKGEHISKEIKDQDGVSYTIKLYKELSQTNLILICPNGHLSDIPWPQFLKWKSEKREKGDDARDLFSYDKCCPTPDLLWTESKTKSEGYGSIYIECLSCGTGSGKDGKGKITLEGVTNLKPFCLGQRPWEIPLEQDSHAIPREDCFKRGEKINGAERMQQALVTGNNVYYASTFSSLYIPFNLAEDKSKELIEGTFKCVEKYQRYLKAKPTITRTEFWEQLNKEDFLIDNAIEVENVAEYVALLKNEFLGQESIGPELDRYEQYRWQEYRCFVSQPSLTETKGLEFQDIEMPSRLGRYFEKIQQIDELQLTQVQLDFSRVRPKQRFKNDAGEVVESAIGREIYSSDTQNVFVLPANESFGEGLFFQFKESIIKSWIADNETILKDRYHNFMTPIDPNSQGSAVKQKIQINSYKHFIIHTFSHIIMRELEFSCGYPTASLKERLYISNRMNGVLIFTSEGSEGSMGGLVWQGNTDKIEELILKSLTRSVNCSSDPLCWESSGQGVFDLNLTACFSCALTSETACEEMNLGLDRRALIDESFGFFKDLIN